MYVIVIFVHYYLLKLFLLEDYIIYFLSIAILLYISRKFRSKKYILTLSILCITLSPFLFEYFDNSIYYFYLFLNLNDRYSYVGGEVTYFLSLLHSIVFFLSYNRKNINRNLLCI